MHWPTLGRFLKVEARGRNIVGPAEEPMNFVLGEQFFSQAALRANFIQMSCRLLHRPDQVAEVIVELRV